MSDVEGVCGSRGPRIGNEGQPICMIEDPLHEGRHVPDESWHRTISSWTDHALCGETNINRVRERDKAKRTPRTAAGERHTQMPWDEPSRLVYYGVDPGAHGNHDREQAQLVEEMARDLDRGAWDLASVMSVPDSHGLAARQAVARDYARRAIEAGWRREVNER